MALCAPSGQGTSCPAQDRGLHPAFPLLLLEVAPLLSRPESCAAIGVHLSPHAAAGGRWDPQVGTLSSSSMTLSVSRALGLLISLVKSNLCLYYHTCHSLDKGALAID